MLGYPGGWTLYNYSKRKWECQCETDDQSRGEKVKKREKKIFEVGGRNKDPKNKGSLSRSWKGKEVDFPIEVSKRMQPYHILILSNLQTCKIINLCTLTLLSLW